MKREWPEYLNRNSYRDTCPEKFDSDTQIEYTDT